MTGIMVRERTVGRLGAAAGTAVRRRGAVVAIPAALSLLLGFWGIRRQDSMWRDESVTYQVAHRGVPEIWRLADFIDLVHSLYYLLMHGVFALTEPLGIDPLTALRLPSVLAVATAAAGVGAIGLRLAGRRAGLLAGTAFAVLPLIQQYAQEGRSYALVCAAVVWATYFFLRAVRRPGGGVWTAYGVTALAACWLNEFAALAVAAHGVTLLWSGAPRAVLRVWGLSVAAVAVGVLPLAVLSLGQSEQQLGWLGRPGLVEWLTFLGLTALGLLCARATGPLPAFPRRARRTVAEPSPPAQPSTRPGPGPTQLTLQQVTLQQLALPLLILPGAVLIVVSLLKPWYVDRYVLYSQAGLALLIGGALGRVLEPGRARRLLPRRAVRWAAAGAAAVLLLAVLVPWSVLMRSPESRKDDVVAVSEAAERSASPGDGLLFMPARRREWALSFPGKFRALDDLALDRDPVTSGTLQGTELPAAAIRRRMLAEREIVALRDPAGQPLDTVAGEVVKRRVLRRYFEECRTVEVKGARVTVYARRGHCGG